MQFWLEFGALLLLLLISIPLLGLYLSRLFAEERCMNNEMTAQQYVIAAVSFTFFGIVFLFLLQLLQHLLPLNPQHMPSVSIWVAFHTAVSFATNTNLQVYAGEKSLSYLTQMVGLTSQNFISAAVGWATFMALCRGIYRHNFATIGNFWDDVTKIIYYLLLPLSCIFALVLVSQGVIQTLAAYVPITTLEGAKELLPMGPVASQESIKLLGSNGGGFFNVNSAHPFENPTPLSNFLETFTILLIPAATIYAYGLFVKNRRHALIVLSVVTLLLGAGLCLSFYGESAMYNLPTPILEGKECRFGAGNSLFWTSCTTATSNGATNAIITSLSPLTQLVAIFQIVIGEIVFGGIGVGMCSLILFILLTLFLSGLMVGRTPEYLGKKIETRDIQWVILAILVPPMAVLSGTAIACLFANDVPNHHSFFSIFYAFASAAGNNGSSITSVCMDTPLYTMTLSVVMLVGRFAIIVPSILLAGNLAKKKIIPETLATAPVNSAIFILILVAVILIFGALTFCPALFLGPIVDHFLYVGGRLT